MLQDKTKMLLARTTTKMGTTTTNKTIIEATIVEDVITTEIIMVARVVKYVESQVILH